MNNKLKHELLRDIIYINPSSTMNSNYPNSGETQQLLYCQFISTGYKYSGGSQLHPYKELSSSIRDTQQQPIYLYVLFILFCILIIYLAITNIKKNKHKK